MTSVQPLIDRLLAIKPADLTLNAWTARAGVSRQVFTDIRRRGNAQHTTLLKLLGAVGKTLGDIQESAPASEPAVETQRAPIQSFRGIDRPRDVPILGTAECADMIFDDDEARVVTAAMVVSMHDVIDYARRPMSLDGRDDVYAIYFVGDSMAPRYEAGELAYVDPRRPPSVRDYVIVQLKRNDGEQDHGVTVLAKRLHRRSSSWIELEQFNPPAIFRVDRADIAHIHRVYPWDELVAF